MPVHWYRRDDRFGPLGALAGRRSGIVLHATSRCMNNQCAVLAQSRRNIVDAGGHLDYTLRRRATLCGVPHVADDHRDLSVIPVESIYDDGRAVGRPGPEGQGSDGHAASITSGSFFGRTLKLGGKQSAR
jgi:hypothetical protein